MKKKILSILLSLAVVFFMIQLMGNTAYAQSTVTIGGFTAPKVGDTCDAPTLTVKDGAYTKEYVRCEWYLDDEKLTGSSKFEAGHTYTLKIVAYDMEDEQAYYNISSDIASASVTGLEGMEDIIIKPSGWDSYGHCYAYVTISADITFKAPVTKVVLPTVPAPAIGQKCVDYNTVLDNSRSSLSASPSESAYNDYAQVLKVDDSFSMDAAISGGRTYLSAHTTKCDSDDDVFAEGRYLITNDLWPESCYEFTDSTVFTKADGTKLSGFYNTDGGATGYMTLELVELSRESIKNVDLSELQPQPGVLFKDYCDQALAGITTDPSGALSSSSYEIAPSMHVDDTFDMDTYSNILTTGSTAKIYAYLEDHINQQTPYIYDEDLIEDGAYYLIRYRIKSVDNTTGYEIPDGSVFTVGGKKAPAFALTDNSGYEVYALVYAGTIDISKTKVTLSKTSYSYTGKAICPDITVYNGSKKLALNTDYTVNSYKSNKKPGTYTIKITGKGIYTGTISKTYKIVPAASSIKSLTPGKNTLTVKATAKPASKGGSYYQIAYKQKGTSGWKYTTTKTNSKTIKSLKKGKTYYVKIRACKKVSGKTYYGAWSKQKLSKKIK